MARGEDLRAVVRERVREEIDKVCFDLAFWLKEGGRKVSVD